MNYYILLITVSTYAFIRICGDIFLLYQKYDKLVCLPLANFDVNDQKDNTEDNADGADNEVTNAEERILSSEPRGRRQHHSLPSTERRHWIRCMAKKHKVHELNDFLNFTANYTRVILQSNHV